jgi:hypothetical protein
MRKCWIKAESAVTLLTDQDVSWHVDDLLHDRPDLMDCCARLVNRQGLIAEGP